MFKTRDIQLLIKDHGNNFPRFIGEALERKDIRAEDLSIRTLAEATIKDGREWVNSLGSRRGGFVSLQEATNAVDTAMFANITGQIIYNKVHEGYNHPDLLWKDLVEPYQTVFLDSERIAGVGGVGDEFLQVEQGKPYPYFGLNEEYIDLPAVQKFGGIVPVTKEIIIADRTALVLKRAADAGRYLGINKEKRVLDVVLGQTNSYKRNGTATNTYLSSGAYTNVKASNALVDWTDIEQAELLFDAMTDPNTGEPILINPDTIIVPSALKRTAMRILSATELRYGDTTSATGSQAIGSVSGGLPGMGAGIINNTYKVVSSAYIKNRTSSASTWFIGKPKEAFVYRTVWEITSEQAPQNSELAFNNDIVMQYKVSEMGVCGVIEPRKMVKCTE